MQSVFQIGLRQMSFVSFLRMLLCVVQDSRVLSHFRNSIWKPEISSGCTGSILCLLCSRCWLTISSMPSFFFPWGYSVSAALFAVQRSVFHVGGQIAHTYFDSDSKYLHCMQQRRLPTTQRPPVALAIFFLMPFISLAQHLFLKHNFLSFW